MNNKTTLENWEERFDKRKVVPNGWINTETGKSFYDEEMAKIVNDRVKQFISDLLEAQREEMIEEVEDRIPEIKLIKCGCKQCLSIKDGWNIARENILAILKEKK